MSKALSSARDRVITDGGASDGTLEPSLFEPSLFEGASTEVADLDVSYMSKSFCLSGLPLRKQYVRDPATRKTMDPQREITSFSRTDDRFALHITADTFLLPDRDGKKSIPFQMGLPYGARARLLILWMTTQARANGGSRWLEIGRINDWLDEAGITPHPDAAEAAKEQLLRLAFARFKMVLDEKSRQQTYFHSSQLISSAIFASEDLENYAAGHIAKVRFPTGIELSEEAYKTFTGSNVIPVSTSQLRQISNNAMSIDLFLFFNYKLPLIPAATTETFSWKALIKQFGNGETPKRFRYVFETSIANALKAYAGANVEISDKGLLMRYSPPAEVRKTTVTVPKLKLVGGSSVRVRNRIAPPNRSKSQTEMDF